MEVQPVQPNPYDSSGQTSPSNTCNQASATFWQDEATLVYHVDIPEGVRLSRRADNDMILAYPLMNLGGMLLADINRVGDAEDKKHIVLQGDKSLIGLWLPYESALRIANRLKLTERVHPLFSRDIEAILAASVAGRIPIKAFSTNTSQQGCAGEVKHEMERENTLPAPQDALRNHMIHSNLLDIQSKARLPGAQKMYGHVERSSQTRINVGPRRSRCIGSSVRMASQNPMAREVPIRDEAAKPDWEEIFSDGDQSPPTEPCLTPPESPGTL